MRDVILLLAGLMLSANALSEPKTIAVKGSGQLEIKPDYILVEFDVINTKSVSVKEANSTVDYTTRSILAALEEVGVGEDAITTRGFQLEQEPEYEEECKVSYIPAIGCNFSLKLKEIDNYDKVIKALVESGASNIQRPVGGLLDQVKHERAALKLAIENARPEAEFLADTLGVKFGPVFSIGERSERSNSDVEEVVVLGIRSSIGKYEHLYFNPQPIKVEAKIHLEFEIEEIQGSTDGS